MRHLVDEAFNDPNDTRVEVSELTSQPRAESVVVAVQQSVQDAREDGDVVVQFGLFGGSGHILGEAEHKSEYSEKSSRGTGDETSVALMLR